MSDRTLALARFTQLVSQPETAIDLTTAALNIAQIAAPGLDITPYQTRLQELGRTLQANRPNPPYPLKVIQMINRFLYEEWGFQGNQDQYYDPRNSFLNEVLDRRLGIPISLAVLYLDLARRVELPMVGIGMPGHFLVRPDFEDAEIFVDVFNQGEILFPQDCMALLAQIYKHPVPFHSEYFAPVSTKSILARLLSNLKQIYLNQGKLEQMLWTVDGILALFPDHAPERKVRGLVHFELGHWIAAQTDLQLYLETIPQLEEARFIEHLLSQIAERLD
ncbi:MAG: tetratricopeptide repeat protein [Spirulina sp. SIO3F2]|nr:tetratricopeptide repeat protein [Spirulina sp. SIO3F2]